MVALDILCQQYITWYDGQQYENIYFTLNIQGSIISGTQFTVFFFQEFVISHITAVIIVDLMVRFAGNIACNLPESLKHVLKCSFDSIRLPPPAHAPLRSGSDTPSLGSTPTPASLRTACWGSWGPWLVGWAGWPAPPRWPPCPPPPPSASPAASAAPAPPLCWSSGCRCRRRSVGLMRRSFKTLEIFNTAQIIYYYIIFIQLPHLDLRWLSRSSPPIVEPSVALSSCCSSCCR